MIVPLVSTTMLLLLSALINWQDFSSCGCSKGSPPVSTTSGHRDSFIQEMRESDRTRSSSTIPSNSLATQCTQAMLQLRVITTLITAGWLG